VTAFGIHTWSGTATSKWPWFTVAVFAVLSVVLAIVLHPIYLLLLAAAALINVAFTKITVTADLEGLHTAFGPWGWPTKRISLDDMESANSINLRPMQWGGWGYRWLPRRGWATVIRKGDAIVVYRKNGKQYAVTVDDAPYGASVLQSLISTRPPS
jgi:hypothetical protein